MKICGIIAEYNPFHTGHAHHMAETRRVLGENTAILAVMSGNYVQRGDAAIFEKYSRARAAVRCGADLVLEMPLSAALSSAAGFAWGGIELLEKLQCVSFLSFGSECGDIESLSETAALLQGEAIAAPLKEALRSGLSYAAAQQKALESISPSHAALLASPNNTLAIEYLCALRTLHSKIKPITIRRSGAAHDARQLEADKHPSASAIRQLIFSDDAETALSYLPAASAEELRTALGEHTAPVSLASCNLALLAHLRRFTVEDISSYTSGDTGLANRLFHAIRTQTNWEAICKQAQTRYYPLARIRRILLRMYLSLNDQYPPTAHYGRVLAIGARGREILRAIEPSGFPLIVKPTTERRLDADLHPLLRLDELSDELYALMQPNAATAVAGTRFRQTPYILPLDFSTRE